jgi:diguanylate cyclase (GGDEF)-like protein
MFNISGRLKKLHLVLIFLLIVDLFLMLLIIQKLEDFADIVNRSGKVRGGIQRVAKLYFAHDYKTMQTVITYVDKNLFILTNSVETLKFPILDRDLNPKPVEVEKCWYKLKKLVLKKDSAPRGEILKISEVCWKKTDYYTDFYQKLVERNVNYLKILYLYTSSVSLFLGFYFIYLIYTELERKLEFFANYDPLTKTFNRASLRDLFFHIKDKKEYQPLSLIIFDLDHFKQINDTFGHNIGDKVLKEVARVVRKNLRRGDIFARWGGEEFVILLPNTDLKGAKKVAEKLRIAIESIKIPELQGRKVTASFGVTQVYPNEVLAEAIHRADMALYKAKNEGRNRIKVFEEDYLEKERVKL